MTFSIRWLDRGDERRIGTPPVVLGMICFRDFRKREVNGRLDAKSRTALTVGPAVEYSAVYALDVNNRWICYVPLRHDRRRRAT